MLGLTAAVGAMAALSAAAIGDPLAAIGLPTVLLIAFAARHSVAAAGYAAAVVWVAFIPRAPGLAMLVPIAMAVICLAIALGPARLMAWVREDFGGRDRHEDATGWIEEA